MSGMPARTARKKTPKNSQKNAFLAVFPAVKRPRTTRPVAPTTYRFPTGPKGLLDWSWARERLINSHNYVIITVRPDGRPHAMGMHGLWIDDAFYFGTGVETRKAKNLTRNPSCILVNERLDELIIVEGTATPIATVDLPESASAASKAKYGWPMGDVPGGVKFKLTPRVVFAFPEKRIAAAVTRWIFD
jgi:hypothetical protein